MKQHFEQCENTYIELHQTVDRKTQYYWLYIESFRTFHFYFISHMLPYQNCIITQLCENNTKFTFLQIGCCSIHDFLLPTENENDTKKI